MTNIRNKFFNVRLVSRHVSKLVNLVDDWIDYHKDRTQF